jgi:hypothetical protein
MTTVTKMRRRSAKPALPEGSIAMSATDTSEAQIMLRFIMHHRELAAKFEQALVDHLNETYGVSVGPGGGYALNVADGRLDRTGE